MKLYLLLFAIYLGSDIKYIDRLLCCVFQPAFGHCAHANSDRKTLFLYFKTFCLVFRCNLHIKVASQIFANLGSILNILFLLWSCCAGAPRELNMPLARARQSTYPSKNPIQGIEQRGYPHSREDGWIIILKPFRQTVSCLLCPTGRSNHSIKSKMNWKHRGLNSRLPMPQTNAITISPWRPPLFAIFHSTELRIVHLVK